MGGQPAAESLGFLRRMADHIKEYFFFQGSFNWKLEIRLEIGNWKLRNEIAGFFPIFSFHFRVSSFYFPVSTFQFLFSRNRLEGLRQRSQQISGHHRYLAQLMGGQIPCQAVQVYSGGYHLANRERGILGEQPGDQAC